MNVYSKWLDWFKSKPRWMQIALITAFCVLFVVGLWLGSPTSTNQQAGELFNSTAWMTGVFLKLILVLGLIYGAAILYKRTMTGSINNPQKQMRIQETLNLTPKRSLHIVKVGEQTLLIGATDQGINLLSELSVESDNDHFQAVLEQAVAENQAGTR